MIRRQLVLPVSPERLWEALTDPDQVENWFGARVEWQLEPGAPARFYGDDGRDRAGRVEAVRPGRHLRFRWWPAPGVPGWTAPPSGVGVAGVEEATPGLEASTADQTSEVSYLLEPVPDGTRLTIQERPLGRMPSGATQARVADRSIMSVPRAAGYASGGAAPAPGGATSRWTAWDGRLAGAWAGLVAVEPEGVRA